jgi:hypothetical protein
MFKFELQVRREQRFLVRQMETQPGKNDNRQVSSERALKFLEKVKALAEEEKKAKEKKAATA